MRRFYLLLIIFIVIPYMNIFSQSSGMEYYLAGIRAYQTQDCKKAVLWLEEALAKDPSIENYDPTVKLKIGFCAYKIGDYDRAKAYLSLYPDNALAKSILELIKSGKKEEVWQKWLMIPKETPPSTLEAETSQATPTKSKIKSIPPTLRFYILIGGIFFGTFLILLFMEWRFGLITTLLLKAFGGRVVTSPREFEPKEVAEEIAEKTEKHPEEKEVEFDLDEILNSQLDVIDKLIYGEDGFIEAEHLKEVESAVEEKVEAAEESKMESTEKSEKAVEEETETEKEAVIKEITKENENVLTESDESEVEKRAEELLKELEEIEDFISVEDAGKTLEEVVEELEKKDKYTPEDAKKFLLLIEKYIEAKSKKEEEAQI